VPFAKLWPCKVAWFLAVAHLLFPGVGHVKEVVAGFEWVPVSYCNRLPTTKDGFEDPHKNGDKH
jgi:hypothetical protein